MARLINYQVKINLVKVNKAKEGDTKCVLHFLLSFLL